MMIFFQDLKNGVKNVKQRQLHVLEKNQYCFKNNITLIRIPYTHYNEITLEDLLNNSQFILHEEK